MLKLQNFAGCSECTAREVLQLHRERLANVHNTFVQSYGGLRSLNQGDVTYISSLLNANLTELQIKLAETQHVDVSIATCSDAMARLSSPAVRLRHLSQSKWR
jgi:hypothetical protein